MKVKKISRIYLLYCLLVILPIYQDTPLSKYLGAAGYSVMMPLSIVVYFLIVILKQNGKIKEDSDTHGLFNLGKWMLITTSVGIVGWCLMGNSITVVGEFLPIKGMKVLLQYVSYPLYVYSMLFCIKKMRRIDRVFKPVLIALVLLALIAFLEQLQIPYAFQALHFAGTFPYYRVRLLTLESSMTALMIMIYAGMSIYYGIAYKKRVVLIISLVCTVYLLLTTGSKSVAVEIALILATYAVIAGKKLKKGTLNVLFVVAIGGVVFTETVLPSLFTYFSKDISTYTSVATRLYTAIIGLGIGIVFPLGVGCAAYLGIFQGALKMFLPWYQSLPIKFNVSEIVSIATRNNDTAVNVKSGILHFNMYWGILGTIYLFAIFHRISSGLNSVRIPNNEILRSIFWVSVIMLVFSSNFQFEFWMLYAIMCGISRLTAEKVQDE